MANGGQVIGYNMVRMQLTFFLVTVFGIPEGAVATMITVMGIWDALNARKGRYSSSTAAGTRSSP